MKRREPIQNTATPRDEHQPKVFISYAFDEAVFANRLVADLAEAGIACWLDTEQIRGGQTFPPALGEAIVNALAVVVIATRKSLQSNWVGKEINWAITHEKEIIPLLFENVRKDPGFFALNDCQWVSMLDGDNHAEALGKLVISLQKIRAELNPASGPQREKELAYLDALEVENLREKYTGMASRSEQPFRHYDRRERRLKVELLPLGKDGSLQPKREEFPDAVEAMLSVRRAALLGEPGGGKSTAMFRLAMDLAEIARRDETKPIPVLALLREWQLADQSLQQFIAAEMNRWREGSGYCLDALLGEKRAALLLDGLNELPVDQRRDKYVQVCQFIARHPNLMAIVSCRKEDYPPELGFDCINISPLDPIRIRQFARNYLEQPELGDELFWKLAGADAKQTQQEFLEKFYNQLPDAEQVFWLNSQLPDGLLWGWEWSEGDKIHKDNWHWENWIRRREAPSGLMTLAGNPFMLNMLISVFKQNQGELPQNRGELFRNFVRIRLERELEGERIEAHEIQPLQEKLAEVAFAMQSRRANDDDEESGAVIVLPKAEVVALFGENHQRWLYLASSAGLLNTDDPVRFTHQLLQEYFAAQHMDIRFRAGDWRASEIWKPDRWWERTNWEVAAVLFTGLYSNDCTRAIEWIAEANPEIAAQCLTRSGVGQTLNEAARKRLNEDWIRRLTDLKGDPNPKARAAIGRALGMTGWDNRKGVGIVERNGLKLPDIDWIRIPEGEFQYGDENEEDNKPQKLHLPEFYISRFPVTYRQFQTFVDDPEGIADARWFEGLAANEEEHQASNQAFKFDNHPRERVSWYQAIAFCRWLSWRLGGKYDLKKVADWEVRLPTEFEWEKAARGTDGRLFPYGNKFDAKKGNTREDKSYIGQTSAVGIFPNGASPYSVEEMSGNVWEWCLTDYNKPQITARKENLRNKNSRVLRGGSWNLFQLYARAVYRYFIRPANRYVNIGFRVVVARPPSSS